MDNPCYEEKKRRIAIPFAFQNLGVLDIGIRPAHVLIVRSAGLTARLPTQISKSFVYMNQEKDLFKQVFRYRPV